MNWLQTGETMIELTYLVILCLTYVTAVDYSKANEGYVNGFSHDCPTSVEPPIQPSALKHLLISVVGPGTRLTSKLTPYDYFIIGDLARNPDIDFSKKTFMFVSGLFEKTMLPYAKNIGQLYKDMGYNVLILNTMHFNRKSYALSVSTVRPLGRYVAEMLANLTAHGLEPKKLELVSYDLGAHTMGFIAKNYRQITGRNISSLTALDPAGPCFRHLGPDDKLDPSDADFVLSVATNMDGLGIAAPVGQVTFYVNGGEYQTTGLPDLFGDLNFILCTIECSHVKFISYWVSALSNPRTFIGIKCDTIQQAREGDCYDRKPMVTNTMDVFTDRGKPGIYYLPTSNSFPYGLGKTGMRRNYNAVANELNWINRAVLLKAR